MQNFPQMQNNIICEDLGSAIEHRRQDDPAVTNGANCRELEQKWLDWLGVEHSLFVDEQILYSATGPLLSQQFNKYVPKVKKISIELDDNYLFENKGRLQLNEENGLKNAEIFDEISTLLS